MSGLDESTKRVHAVLEECDPERFVCHEPADENLDAALRHVTPAFRGPLSQRRRRFSRRLPPLRKVKGEWTLDGWRATGGQGRRRSVCGEIVQLARFLRDVWESYSRPWRRMRL